MRRGLKEGVQRAVIESIEMTEMIELNEVKKVKSETVQFFLSGFEHYALFAKIILDKHTITPIDFERCY